MTIVASDSTQTRSAASMLLRYQVARAVLAGAIGAFGVVALSAVALALLFGLVPTNPVSASSQLPDEPGIIAEPPALAGSNLATLSQSDRDAKPLVVEPTSEREAPVQKTTVTQASLVPPPKLIAGAVSPSANLLSTTPFGPRPVTFVPAASMQARNTSVEPAEPEPVAQRTVVNKPRSVVADKKVANSVAERVGAVASIKKAALIRPVNSTPVTQPRGTEAIQTRSGLKAEPAPSRESQRHKIPRKPMVTEAATALTVTEAAASLGQAAPAPAETEHLEGTEVFGLKVPSFAPAGRKIRESVEAFGAAVKSLPDIF